MLSGFTIDIRYKPDPTNKTDPLIPLPVGKVPSGEVLVTMVTRWYGGNYVARVKHAYGADPRFNEQSNLTRPTCRIRLWYTRIPTLVSANAQFHNALLHAC